MSFGSRLPFEATPGTCALETAISICRYSPFAVPASRPENQSSLYQSRRPRAHSTPGPASPSTSRSEAASLMLKDNHRGFGLGRTAHCVGHLILHIACQLFNLRHFAHLLRRG